MKRGIYRMGIALSLLILAGAGCDGAPKKDAPAPVAKVLPQGFSLYNNSVNMWTIGFPQDWKLDESALKEKGIVFFYSPSADTLKNANVNVQFTPGAVPNLKEILGEIIVSLESVGAKNVKGTEKKVGANDALQISYDIKSADTQLFGNQYMIVAGGGFYAITFTGTQAAKNAYAQTFEDMVASFATKK